ncbi:hypothetical protein B591_04859 [Streptomyces sp. GBA 94-10 4N24]|nr:hypothetical protein B591_04859 [Streptomyces sp. GBA 94-10 4N24]MBP3076679.1 hypothetical protein [Streptomyces sp. 604F]QOZ98616.1 hypothetical protein DI273_04985 [Streptomyces violascens]UZN57990.1 hypothetical protein B591N_04859 [Streptomyces sp. GBA 94-10 4N24]
MAVRVTSNNPARALRQETASGGAETFHSAPFRCTGRQVPRTTARNARSFASAGVGRGRGARVAGD